MSTQRMRWSAVVAGVAVLFGLAGCGPDLTKETFKPTKVAPKPGSGATEPVPEGAIDDSALTPAKLRTVDACKLMNDKALADVGKPEGDAYVSDPGRCTRSITDTNGQRTTLSMSVGEGLSGTREKATAGLEGLPMRESIYDRSCSLEVLTSEEPAIGIRMSATSDQGAGSCAAGRKVTARAIQQLKKDAPQLKVAKGSLLPVDPCKTIDAKTLESVTDVELTTSQSGLHACSSAGSGPTVSLTFRFNYPPERGTETARLSDSVKADVTTTSSTSCTVSWTHRKLADDKVESVRVDYAQYIDKPGIKTLCKNATTLAKSVLKKLPKA